MRSHSWGLAGVAVVAVAVIAVVAVLIARNASSPAGQGTGASAGSSTGNRIATVAGVTHVHRVSPVDASGRLRAGYRVAARGRGRCFSPSLIDDGLYRCFRGNAILDPCWRQAGRGAVLCLPRPWSPRATRVRLTGNLPPQQHLGSRLWALRIGDGVGARCLAAMGATGKVGHRPISFVCGRGWVLLGNGPNRRESVWTMPTARSMRGHYRPQGTAHLTDAWRAVTG